MNDLIKIIEKREGEFKLALYQATFAEKKEAQDLKAFNHETSIAVIKSIMGLVRNVGFTDELKEVYSNLQNTLDHLTQ